ncbi:MAG: mercuric transporter MerT family protein [Thermodesulfobacteriota bacterium]
MEAEVKSKKERQTIVGVIIAAIVASVCCVGPLLLLGLGIGGAWVGNLTALEPFRPYLMGLTLFILGYAFYKIYSKPKVEECEPGSYCANPKADRNNKIILWISTVFVISLLAFPYLTPYIFANENNIITQPGFSEVDIKVVVLDVPDMYCATCPVTVQKSLIKLDGVITAEASFEDKKAMVIYDSTQVSIDQLIEATTNAGYPSSIK